MYRYIERVILLPGISVIDTKSLYNAEKRRGIVSDESVFYTIPTIWQKGVRKFAQVDLQKRGNDVRIIDRPEIGIVSWRMVSVFRGKRRNSGWRRRAVCTFVESFFQDTNLFGSHSQSKQSQGLGYIWRVWCDEYSSLSPPLNHPPPTPPTRPSIH